MYVLDVFGWLSFFGYTVFRKTQEETSKPVMNVLTVSTYFDLRKTGRTAMRHYVNDVSTNNFAESESKMNTNFCKSKLG